MKIFNAVRQWWTRREALEEEKNKILKDRLARLFNETAIPRESSCPEQNDKQGRKTVDVIKG
jgi:hypothetical protein